MRRLTRMWMPVVLLGLSVSLVAACGGDDPEDSTNETATATATESSAETATGTAEATSAGGEGSGDVEEIFSEMSDAMSEGTFSVTYEMSGTSGGQAIEGEWVWVQDPANNRSRYDARIDGQEITAITTAEATIICAQGTCFDTSALGAGAGAMANPGDMLGDTIGEAQTDAEAAAGSVEQVDSRTIAGIEASCYEYTGTGADEAGTVCLAPSGVPLLMETAGADGVTMEATAYSDDVDDASFEPPYPLGAFPGIPSN